MMSVSEGIDSFREQIEWLGCLSECLSGNGQESLNAPIPAPGGDQ